MAIAALIASLGFAVIFVSQGFGVVALVGFALLYLAVAIGTVAVIAWGTLIGIRYYDHTMRDA